MATISGLWVFNERNIDFTTFGVGSSQAVTFVDDNNTTYAGIRIGGGVSGNEWFYDIYYDYPQGHDPEMSFVYTKDYTGYDSWGALDGDGVRYIQFGTEQTVSDEFYNWMSTNATNVGEGSIDVGDYCFKLNLSDYLATFLASRAWFTCPFLFTTYNENMENLTYIEASYDAVSLALFTDYGLLYHIDMMSSPTPEYLREYGAFGWTSNGFTSRVIHVSTKQYFSYTQYAFLTGMLTELNSQNFLDTTGTWQMAQNLDKMSDLCLKYASNIYFTPVADTLYYNANGATSVTGLNLSNYLFVTIKARGSSAFTYPVSTSFAVQNITDCGTMQIQIADPAYYCVWNVTKNSISLAGDSLGSGQVIMEVIGYRWDSALRYIETPTPTYAYKYVTGALACSAGNNFNNFYNYDCGTEFRVELNFYIDQDTLGNGIVLADNTASSGNYWKLSINSSGKLVMNNAYSGKSASATWSNFTVAPRTWYSLSLYSNNITSQNWETTQGIVYASIVPYAANPTHNYKSVTINRFSQVSTTRKLIVGATNLWLRGAILVKGTKYHSGNTNTQAVLSVNVEDATVGDGLSLTSGLFTLVGGQVEGVQG